MPPPPPTYTFLTDGFFPFQMLILHISSLFFLLPRGEGERGGLTSVLGNGFEIKRTFRKEVLELFPLRSGKYVT